MTFSNIILGFGIIMVGVMLCLTGFLLPVGILAMLMGVSTMKGNC